MARVVVLLATLLVAVLQPARGCSSKAPVCRPRCVNSNCYEYNNCVCHAGYAKFKYLSNICYPTCVRECINGQCSAPNSCTCHSGYGKDSRDQYRCHPICPHGCEHGDCTAPGVCTCHAGYTKQRKDSNICVASCEAGCTNGYCKSDNTCVCHEGYAANRVNPAVCERYTRQSCAPSCPDGCRNGSCVAPGLCHCDEGFAARKGLCEPQCSNACLNGGECTAPETCLCAEGWTGAACEARNEPSSQLRVLESSVEDTTAATSTEPSPPVSKIEAIIYLGVTLSIIVTLAFVVLFCFLCRRSTRTDSCEQTLEEAETTPVNSENGSDQQTQPYQEPLTSGRDRI